MGSQRYTFNWEQTSKYLNHVRACFGDTEEDGEYLIEDPFLINKDGRREPVLLPFDLEKLASIEVTLLPRNQIAEILANPPQKPRRIGDN